MLITELLAVLSISAAAGFHIALPLLLIGFMSADLWAEVPFLSRLPPTVVVGALVSWSLVELVFSKQFWVQRLLQSAGLFLSPIAGAIAGLAIARSFQISGWLAVLLGIVSALLALVIHLVQVGWLYRLKQPSPWLMFAEDFLCVGLVLLAFDAPRQGGLIALLLLWLALRTSYVWRQWYLEGNKSHHPPRRRRLKREPD